jgi:hypothetical protein
MEHVRAAIEGSDPTKKQDAHDDVDDVLAAVVPLLLFAHQLHPYGQWILSVSRLTTAAAAATATEEDAADLSLRSRCAHHHEDDAAVATAIGSNDDDDPPPRRTTTSSS